MSHPSLPHDESLGQIFFYRPTGRSSAEVVDRLAGSEGYWLVPAYVAIAQEGWGGAVTDWASVPGDARLHLAINKRTSEDPSWVESLDPDGFTSVGSLFSIVGERLAAALARFGRLERLVLDGAAAVGDKLPTWPGIEALRFLSLQRSPAPTEWLGSFAAPDLEVLHLGQVPGSERVLDRLATRFPSLLYLSLGYANVDGATEEVGLCSGLRELDVECASLDFAALATALAQLPKLALLRANFTAFDDVALSALAKSDLRVIEARGCPLTDDSVPLIAAMNSLRAIALAETAITEDGFTRLGLLRPDLAVDDGHPATAS